METEKFKEKLVKQSLLDNEELFTLDGSSLGNNRIVFEKVVNFGALRCDALLFTENKGIIGIEIKTEYDNLRRLSRQLNNYRRVCNYVYVYCHDKHLKAVLKLIKDHHWENFVGVISYSIFDNEVIPGVYQSAKPSPYYQLKNSLQMLWKSEIRDILQVTTSEQARMIAVEEGLNYIPVYHQPANHKELSGMPRSYGIATSGLTKPQLIRNYVSLYGQSKGTQILCQRFIYADSDPSKFLKLFHFNDRIDNPKIVGNLL